MAKGIPLTFAIKGTKKQVVAGVQCRAKKKYIACSYSDEKNSVEKGKVMMQEIEGRIAKACPLVGKGHGWLLSVAWQPHNISMVHSLPWTTI